MKCEVNVSNVTIFLRASLFIVILPALKILYNIITNFNPKYTSVELEQISHSFYTPYTGNGDGVRICMYKPYTAFRECVLISQLT